MFKTLGTNETKFPNQESHFRKSFPQSKDRHFVTPPCQSISAILFHLLEVLLEQTNVRIEREIEG